MKRFVLVLIALAVVAAAVFLRSRLFENKPEGTIRVSGNIELTEVSISFKLPGRLTALNVREGMEVRKGFVVAELDRESLLRQKDRDAAALNGAQSALVQHNTAIEHMRVSIDRELDLRRADLAAAEARLKELEAGSRPQEIRQARAQLDDATLWQEQARRDWERAQQLFKNEDISAAQHDQYRVRFESASMTLRQARERLALIEEGPRQETIEAARAQVARAQAAIGLAEAGRIDLKRREQDLAGRRAEIDRARANLAVIEAQLADTTVASPIDGVVLVKSAEQGEVQAAGAVVATIGDLARPWLRAYISETDLGKVKLGAKVKLTTDSFPGKAYHGRVSFISSVAEFTPKQIQTPDERVKLVYRIKIDVDNPSQELKANMPVDAEIVL
jgi:HlyD family secretion protein